MTFIKDDNLTVAPAQRHRLDDHQCHRARLTVARHATDAADLAHLLDVLGLTAEHDTTREDLTT